MNTYSIHLQVFVFLFTAFCCSSSVNAQQDVYANQLVSNSSDIQYPVRAVDANQTNYAYASNLLGLLSTTYMRVRFPENRNAGDIVNVIVQSTGTLLTTNILTNTTLKLYDSAGNQVAVASGNATLSLSLLVPGSNIYAIKFFTNPANNYTIREARLEINNLASINLLSEFRIYSFNIQTPCPPVYADAVYASGTSGSPSLLSGYVANAVNAVDVNPNNYATLNVPLNILILPPAYLDLSFPFKGRAGDYVGFTIGQASSLLSLTLIQSIDIKVYDDAGVLRDSKNNFALADLKLLTGTSDKYTIGFATQSGTYRIKRLKITMNGVVSVLQNLNVYNAFCYRLSRPQVTITVSGPTTFCEGGSVTLTANDSLGVSNYYWSNGATTPSITVTQSGVFSVEVMDSAACSRKSIQLAVNVLPKPNPIIAGDSVLCLGASGVLQTTIPYSGYQWNTNATSSSININTPGKYYVTVTDTNTCTNTDTIIVQRNNLNIIPNITGTTCSNGNNGSVALTVSGGSGVYTYYWSTGGLTSSINNQKPGIYTAIIEDSVYGCSYNRAYSIIANNTLSIKTGVVNTSGCGKHDGKIFTSVVGGSGNYSYLWSNAATTANLDSLFGGIYTVTVTDINTGCQVSDTAIVNDANNTLLITPTVNPASGCAATDGSISTTVTGGSGNYAYTWSNGATTSGISNLASGNYYVVVRDVLQECRVGLMINVPVNGMLSVNGNVNPTSCNGKTGSISLSVSNGSGSYSYYWSTGATTAGISNLQAGTYIVTVTDNVKGCTAQKIFNVVESGGPSATLNITQPLCGSNNGGSISVTPAVLGNYLYQWSNGYATKDIFNLKPGTYVLTMTDSISGCSSSYLAALSTKKQILLTASPKPNTSCASAPNGAINLVATKGQSPYSYLWNNTANTPNISNLAPGTYSVSVQDANGCNASLSVPVITDSSKLLNVFITSVVKASCSTAINGGLNATANGGTAPYTYSWSNSSTVQNLSNVSPGTYTLTVTDAVGCSKQMSGTVTVDTSYHVLVGIDSIIAAGCSGSNSGAVYITPSGGTSPYSYNWSNNTTSKNLLNVLIGTYTVNVTDARNCSAQQTAIVPLSTNVIVLNVDSTKKSSCSVNPGGAAYVSISGGKPPYSYVWSNNATTKNLLNVVPGTYILTATDANGCSKQVTATIQSDSVNTLHVAVDSVRGAACASGTTAAIFITASTGALPYNYHWSNGSTAANLLNITPGIYSVQVTDANGCVVTASAHPGVDTSKSIHVFVDSVKGAGCAGSASGSIYIHATGGVSPYTYFWNNLPAGQAGSATLQNLINVPPASYTVTVSDNAGCSTQKTGAVIVDTAHLMNVAVDSILAAGCSGSPSGSVYIHVNNGYTPFTYAWSNNSTGQNLLNVPNGNYSVTVTDNVNCSAQQSAVIPVGTNYILLTLDSIRRATCNVSGDGSVYVSISGGKAPYTFLWNNNATTKNLLNVNPGTYQLTATDANGCTAQLTAILPIDSEHVLKVVVDSLPGAGCATGHTAAIYITASLGTAPYTYHWSNGAISQNLVNITPGVYSVQVTDAKGCMKSLSANPGIDAGKTLYAIIDSVHGAGCNGSNSGSVYMHGSGGKPPYSYFWSNGATSQNLSNVPPGNYTITVNDTAGCSAQQTATIGIDSAHLLHINVDSATAAGCIGSGSGAIYISVTGGQTPYAYSWSNNTTSQNLLNVQAGTYTVTVTDGHNCASQKAANVPVSNTNLMTFTVDSFKKATCMVSHDGSVYMTVTGGLPPYTYSWSNGISTKNLLNVNPGNYTLTAIDANGCPGQYTVAVVMDTNITLKTVVDSTVGAGCSSGNTAAVYITASGGTLPYSYSWSNGSTSSNLNNVTPGNYTVQVTDARGCVVIKTAQPGVDTSKGLHIYVDSIKGAACAANNSGTIYIHNTGGKSPYYYTWSNGSNAQNVSNVAPGNYTVTVNDAGGCNKQQTATIGIDSAHLMSIAIDSILAAGCNGSPSGSVYIHAINGLSPFTYNWSNNTTSQHLINVSNNIYIVTVTDAHLCQAQKTAIVPVGNNLILVNVDSIKKATCAVSHDGAAFVYATGGKAPYTYSWSNGTTAKNLLNVNPGSYTVIATDANGCSGQTTVTITVDTAITLKAVVDSTLAAGCASGTTAAIFITASGGTLPYTYYWSNSATTANLLNVTPGVYSVQITDAKGCVITKTAQPGIDTNKGLKILVDSVRGAACVANNSGAIYVHTTGGKSPYSYTWSNGSNAQNLSNISPSTYTVTVNDAAGCNKQQNVNVGIDSAHLMNVVTDSIIAAGCNGSLSGGVYVHVVNGLNPFAYYWSNGSTSQNLLNVSNGNYTVTVTDAHQCQAQKLAMVGISNNLILIGVDSIKKATCNVSQDGKAYMNISGGKAPYTYNWSNGTTTKNLLNVNPGAYSVTTTDANGCTAQTSVNIGIDTAATLKVVVDSTIGAACTNGHTAAIYTTASGGTLPYNYTWSDGAHTSNLVNIIPGTYTVQVTDARGCVVAKSAQPGVDPNKVMHVFVDSLKGAECIGSNSGSIYIHTTGGKSPYTYSWSNSAISQNLSNVSPGNYNVTIADAGGCNIAQNISLGIDTSLKMHPHIDSTIGAGCTISANGKIYMSNSGGKPPYSYAWSNGAGTQNLFNVVPGAYGVQVTDANGCSIQLTSSVPVDTMKKVKIISSAVHPAACAGNSSGSIIVNISGGGDPYTFNWSNGMHTQNLNNILPGTYALTVTDFGGCTANFQASLGIDTPNLMHIQTANIQKARCPQSQSGSIEVGIVGGAAPFNYSWTNGVITQNIYYVPTGNYALTVTDVYGCVANYNAFVGIDTSNPVKLHVDSTKAADCRDSTTGAVYVSTSGGLPPYTHLWTNGSVTEDIYNVAPGAYTVTATDDAGCRSSITATVQRVAPIVFSADIHQLKCYGDRNGSIILDVNGGSGLYQYHWSNGEIAKQINNLVAGRYYINVEDATTGCARQDSFLLTQPDSIALVYSTANDSCFGAPVGGIILEANGGITPYTYGWSNGNSTASLRDVHKGLYTIIVKDANDCINTRKIEVSEANCDFTLNIHNAITPNGDGMNDYWVIEGIAYYPNNIIQIFDKWGDKVYEEKGYHNTWSGRGMKGELPNGTYYYVLKLNDANRTGGKNDFSGYLMIQR